MAKAKPRIPLPIMALLRLKMDMPNDVFPSNCTKTTTEGSGQIIKTINYFILLQQIWKIKKKKKKALTSVKWTSFFVPGLCGRNSSCSAKASRPSNLQRRRKKKFKKKSEKFGALS